MMFYIALGVSVLLFGFLAYLASKVWTASHVVLLSFVFIFSMLFMVLAALSLRTQDAWRSIHTRLEKQIAQTDADIEALKSSTGQLDEEPSVPALKAELGRLMIDRGRIWRGARPGDVPGEGIVLSMLEWGDAKRVAANLEEPDEFADPAAEGEAPANTNPHGIVEGQILHAFIEAPVPETLGAILFPTDSVLVTERAATSKLPVIYAGKYRVTAQTDASITVNPVMPLDAAQTEAVNMANVTWALYETLPQDSRNAFQRLNDDGEMVNMETEQLAQLFPQPQGQLAQQLLQTSFAEFIRDQGPATDDDPLERRHVKVRFTQPYSVQVDFEDETEDSPRSYDAFGRAVLDRLKQGQATEFAEGDLSVFDHQTAGRLVREGVAEFVDEPPVYLRPLRNYDRQLRQRTDTIADLAFQAREIQKKIAAANQADELARQQIAYRQDEIQKLGEDKSNFASEQQVVRNYLAQLKQLRETQLATLSAMYQQNLGLRGSQAGAAKRQFGDTGTVIAASR